MQDNNMLKTLLKYMAKTTEGSAKEATKRKQDQHILLKVQDCTWFLEKYITMPPVGEINYTREDDSHQD